MRVILSLSRARSIQQEMQRIKRMQEALKNGEKLPLAMEGNVIYYMGPSPAREGRPIGSAGPTTASRMDKYARSFLISD